MTEMNEAEKKGNKKKIKTKDGQIFLAPISKKGLSLTEDLKETIYETPALILHLITFPLTKNTRAFIKKHSHMIEQADKGDIRYYFNELMLSEKPSDYFVLMRDLNILEVILPELNNCIGVYQNGQFHKYDVFYHCIYTADNVENELTLRLAALFHDVGKPTTYKILKGHATFHKHDVVGASITYKALKRMGYNKSIIKNVVHLVRLHMYHYTKSWSNKAVKRFIKRADINDNNINNLSELPLFKLRAADRMGGGTKHTAITEVQKKFEDRIRNVYQRMKEEEKEQTILQQESKLDGINRFELERIFTPEIIKVEDENFFEYIIDYLYTIVTTNKIPNKKLELLSETVRYIKMYY